MAVTLAQTDVLEYLQKKKKGNSLEACSLLARLLQALKISYWGKARVNVNNIASSGWISQKTLCTNSILVILQNQLQIRVLEYSVLNQIVQCYSSSTDSDRNLLLRVFDWSLLKALLSSP
jgi:hypothetical protein